MVQRGQALVVDGHEIPPNWQIGGFELEIGEITEGRVDEKAGILRGAAGKAWLRLPCARPPIYTVVPEKEGPSRLSHAVEVVDRVLHPQTEIGIAEARRLRPGVAVGETIALDLAVDHADLQEIVQLGRGVGDWLGSDPRTVGFPLAFSGLTVSLEDAKQALGRVTLGSVTWPAAGSFRGPIEIDIDGFTLIVSSLQLSPTRSTGVAKARLPGGLTDVDSCQPATLDLGRIAMSPVCDFYVDAPGQLILRVSVGRLKLQTRKPLYVSKSPSLKPPSPKPSPRPENSKSFRRACAPRGERGEAGARGVPGKDSIVPGPRGEKGDHAISPSRLRG